jgi:hypothetical protein
LLIVFTIEEDRRNGHSVSCDSKMPSQAAGGLCAIAIFEMQRFILNVNVASPVRLWQNWNTQTKLWQKWNFNHDRTETWVMTELKHINKTMTELKRELWQKWNLSCDRTATVVWQNWNLRHDRNETNLPELWQKTIRRSGLGQRGGA